ncbi:MAG: DNA polymerase III subunit beta [Actinomycetota bacterium]
MRIRCSREHLAERLAQASRVASTRANLQSAAHVRIDAGSAEAPAQLVATDLEMTLRVPLDADVEEPGSALLPAKIAPELVRALAGEQVELATGEGGVRVSAGSSAYTLYGLPVDEFPQVPDVDLERAFETDVATFAEVVNRVKRAASRDESRPVLTGALVRFEAERLVMAATDSYRLAVAEAPLASAAPEPLEAIIPVRALEEAVRIAGEGDGPLSVSIGEGLVSFGANGIWLSARRIEGQFPNFSALRPEGIEHSVAIAKDELLENVRRVGIVARQNTPVRVELAPGKLSLSARTADLAEGAESIPVGYDGTETVEIGFNHEFLRDGVESVPGDEVRLGLISSLRPALLESADGTFWYVIMPIRL